MAEIESRPIPAELVELFVKQIDEAVFVTNATRDRVLYVSPAFERITGLSCERVYASAAALAEVIHPDDRPTFIQVLGSVPGEGSGAGSGEQVEREYRVLRRSPGSDAEPELRWIWARYGLVSPGDETDTRIVGTLTDITARKLATQEREQLGRVMALFDSAIDEAFLLLNPTRDRVLYASASVERMFGVSQEAAYADIHALFDHLHPEDRERLSKIIGQPIPADQTGLNYEYRVSLGGQLRWIVSRVRVLDADSPMPGAVVSISMDITARREADDRLRQLTEDLEGRVAERTASLEFERQRLRKIIDGMAVHVGILDPDGRIQQLNARAKAATKMLSESIIGHTIDTLPGVEYAGASLADARRALDLARSGQPARFDLEILHGPGERRVTDTSLSPIFDTNGRVTEFVWTGIDVTDRRINEQRLRESHVKLEFKEARLAAAQRMAEMGDWSWDIRTNALQWSDQIYRMIGREVPDKDSAAALTYDDFLVTIHDEDRARVMAAVDHAVATGDAYEVEHRLVHLNGEVRIILETGEVTRDDHGVPLRMHGTAQDITRQKTIETQLRASLSEKDALVKEVHHRVKNNLQVVSSLLYLQGTNANDHVRAVLEECRMRIRSMALVHEQLYISATLSKIEMHLYFAALGEELARIYSSDHAPEIVVIGSGLVLDVERAVPVALLANELLTNALKYAYPKSMQFVAPQVRVRVSADALMIEDDGVGLPADLDETTTHSLGLRMVRVLVRQLDATLEFVRERGTSVCIQLAPNPEDGSNSEAKQGAGSP